MLAYGEWLEDNVLAPAPHRQYVFALPKLIRPFFAIVADTSANSAA